MTPFKAYKGFDKDLKCKDHQFVVGEIASKPEVENPRLCSNQGFHYCRKLEDVYEHYCLSSSHRFCEIEVLGKFTEDGKKGITTSLKLIREIPKDELYEIQTEENLNLDKVRALQKQYPLVHVGGSIGLFLHGVRLERWQYSPTDIDAIAPYFILFESFEEGNDDFDIEYIDGKKSSNDFDQNFVLNSTKVDLRVDPKQRYELIEYKGFKYKVSTFETIMEAKMRYAVNGQQKHKDDIREMCISKKQEKKVPVDYSLPF